MSSAVRADSTTDLTDLPYVLRSAVSLGGLTALLVVVMSFLTRFLAGVPEFALGAVVVLGGAAAVTFLPGRWTRPRTIEGIAGAAGIGLAAHGRLPAHRRLAAADHRHVHQPLA